MIIAETGSMSYWRKGTGQVIYFPKNVPFSLPWYPLPLYARAEDEREVNGRSRSLSLEGRGAG